MPHRFSLMFGRPRRVGCYNPIVNATPSVDTAKLLMLVVIMILSSLSWYREAMIIIGPDRTIELTTEILWFVAVDTKTWKPRVER